VAEKWLEIPSTLAVLTDLAALSLIILILTRPGTQVAELRHEHAAIYISDQLRDSVNNGSEGYYDLATGPHRRTASTITTESIRPVASVTDPLLQ
jgi:hypothetical protein